MLARRETMNSTMIVDPDFDEINDDPITGEGLDNVHPHPVPEDWRHRL